MSSIPKGYKKTEVGVIPESWDVKNLESICELLNGYAFKAKNYSINGEFKVITITNIQRGFFTTSCVNYISFLPIDIQKHQILDIGDILISMTGTIVGHIARVNEINCLLNQRVGKLKFNKNVDTNFIYSVLNRIEFETCMTSIAAGGAQVNLNKNDILSYQVSLPPLPEQKAIAKVLSDMDALIEAQKALLAKKKDIKQGAMQDLLSGHVRLPGYETKGWKHTDIGEIPDDWEVKILGEEGVFLTTSSYTRSDLREYGDVACIHYGDIHTRFHTWLDCSSIELPMISKDMVKQYPYLRNGDLVIADASEDYEGLGDCVEICNMGSKLCIGGLHTIVYRARPALFAPFYIGLLRNLQVVRNQLVSQAVGTKVYSLTTSMIGAISVPIPSLLPEQKAIAQVLSDMDNEIETLEAELEKLNHMKRGMMQELLTGRIRLV